MIDIIAEIRENETGIVKEYEMLNCISQDDGYEVRYIWSDGNYGCDCNRHMFFDRVDGRQEEDYECSDGLYSVRVRNKETGLVIYSEFP